MSLRLHPRAALIIGALCGLLAFGRFHTASEWFSGGWHAALVVVTVIAGSLVALGIYRRVSIWLAGSGPVRLDRPGDRLRRLLRLGVLQTKLRRDPVIGGTHLLLSAAFALVLLWYTARSLGLGVRDVPTPIVDVLYLALAAAAAVMLWARASGARPRLRRDWQGWAIPSLLLAIAMTYLIDRGLGIDASGHYSEVGVASQPARFAHVLCISSFFALIPYTKLFHVIAAPVSIFLANHETQGVPPAPFDLRAEDELSVARRGVGLGARRVGDLSIARLASVDACTTCGRCQDVCPAYATGKPLSPMKLVQEVWTAARSGPETSLWSTVTADEVLSCTTCGACVAECPVAIDHVGLVTELRRGLLDEGRVQEGHAKTLRRIVETDNPWGSARSGRASWAEAAGFEEAVEGEEYDYLYWLGCAASFDARAQEIARTVHDLLRRAGLRVATLGSRERCTGEAARRAGDEGLFQRLAAANIEAISSVRAKAIVTHCPHCLQSIGKEYALLGGEFRVRHHTEVIAELVDQGRLAPDREVGGTVTYHDPCYLGRHNGRFEEPRQLLRILPATELREMPRSGDRSFCCGAGGAAMWQGGELGERVNLARVEQALATGATTIATGCPFCTAMLEEALQSAGADGVVVRDVSELVADSLGPA